MKNKSIRITHLVLKNYAPFFESMGIKHFEFDRSNSKNNLVLILGANGAGKSFLMSELSPEPIEHVAGRTTNRYIDGEEGRKEVTFVVTDKDGVNTDKYLCTIVYSADRRKTICYFTHINLFTGKEEELNPNGNVSSYMDLCKKYLGYDKNYKNIGYLSEDVKNLVSMSFTERQQLISNWLPNTSDFLSAAKIAQKKRNQTQKEIEGLLKDIAKISTGDIEKELASEEEKLQIKKAKLEKVKDGLSKSSLIISILDKYKKEEFVNLKNKYLLEVKEYNSDFLKNKETLDKYSAYIRDSKGQERLLEDIHKLDIEREQLVNNEKSYNDELIRLTSDIENMSIKEDSSSSDYNLVSVTETIDRNKNDLFNVEEDIKKCLKENEDYCEFVEYKPEYKITSSATINALMSIALISNKISTMCGNYEFKAIFDSKTGEDVESIINNLKKTNIEYNNQINNLETKIRESEQQSVDFSYFKKSIPSHCNENTCSLIKLLLERARDNSSNIMITAKNEIDKIKEKIEANNKGIEENQRIKQNLQNALYDMIQVTDTLKTLDDKTYNLPKSLRDEINSPVAYNVLVKTSLLLDAAKKYDEYVSLLEKKANIVDSIEKLENISSLLTMSEESKRILQSSINRRKEISELLKSTSEKLIKINTEKESLVSLKDKISLLREERNKLTEKHDKLINDKENLLSQNKCIYNKTQIESCIRKLRDLEFSLNKDISGIQSKIESYKTQITSIEVLKNRKLNLDMKKELYSLAYQIWSAEGYPSLLINDFLDEVKDCTNKDLDTSWGGMLSIDKFKLDSTSLKVPVLRGNSVLNDISECSKAEKATLDLALSFGILEVSTKNELYNIVKIDEKDSGMDSTRRQTFLDILQERLNNFNCKNAFCITHSNCFDNVEADVILLKGYENMISETSLSNKNVIYRYDKSI